MLPKVEFEAQFIMDLQYAVRGMGCGYYAAGQNYGASYSKWIIDLTSEYTHFPTLADVMIITQDGLGFWNFFRILYKDRGLVMACRPTNHIVRTQ